MCSIGEEDFGDEGGLHTMKSVVEDNDISELTGACPKCNIEPVAVKIGYKEAQCKSCFLAYVRHKFRATLGSSKILPKNADVLLIFDGSQSSVSLLHMAHNAQTQNSFKRLHCNLKVLVIDDSFLGHQEPCYMEKIFEIVRKYDLCTYYTSLASTGFPVKMLDANVENSKDEVSFKEKIESIKCLTSRQDFIATHRKNVIRKAALNLGMPCVFLPDISPDLATVFLTNISLGRGCSTALDIGLIDDREVSVKIIRPLKDLTENEVQHYVRFNNLPVVLCKIYGENAESMASIQNLTKSFVANLQEKFPATVSTVFRTGSKIAAKSEVQPVGSRSNQAFCRLCHCVIHSGESKTLLAIEFSRTVSEFAANGLKDMSDLEGKARDQLNEQTNKQLCHACRNILRDCNGDLDAELCF